MFTRYWDFFFQMNMLFILLVFSFFKYVLTLKKSDENVTVDFGPFWEVIEKPFEQRFGNILFELGDLLNGHKTNINQTVRSFSWASMAESWKRKSCRSVISTRTIDLTLVYYQWANFCTNIFSSFWTWYPCKNQLRN